MINTGDTIAYIDESPKFVKLRLPGIKNAFLKMEGFNAAGSIKIKTAIALVENLEKSERIGKDSILIESSSGSLGVALSIVCAERGYRFLCITDPNAASSSVKMMRTLGAEVEVISKRDANNGYLGTRIQRIQSLVGSDPRFLWLNQYANPANPAIHAETTAKEIHQRFNSVNYLFVGAGTTGTLMGCVKYFSENAPGVKIIAVDSIGSVTFGHPSGKRHIPGLGTSRRPEIYHPDGIEDFVMISEEDAIATCRYLARARGLLVGGSTGTVVSAIYQWRNKIPSGATVVGISPDMGERYLDTIYDDAWVMEKYGRLQESKIPVTGGDGV